MSLSVTSVYPYFLISALLLGVGWAISRKSPFYGRLLEAEETSKRFHAIDGLRGFLALGVFFHHAVVSYFYYQHGRWELPPSQFYTLTGQVGVALFFMITGFLFWTKGLVARPFLRAQPMFWSRLRRLVPMYLFSIACVFAVVAALTDFEMRQTAKTLVEQSMAWLSFGFVVPGELNGLQESGIINASVQWTLAYEWMFYLFLPFGLIFARGIGFLLLIAASAACIQAFSTSAVEWNFLFGAVAALLIAEYVRIPAQEWNSRFISLFVVAVIVISFSMFENGYGLWQAALLCCAFVCIAGGNRLFGLLTCRAARLLGMISYSLYLMHAIVLFVTLKLVNKIAPISGMAPENYWAIVAGCGIVLVAICAVSYRLIEHPLMMAPMPGWLGGRTHGDGAVQGR
jgi:peptidoglycan/LPS O-acetylase OafA/YrhL